MTADLRFQLNARGDVREQRTVWQLQSQYRKKGKNMCIIAHFEETKSWPGLRLGIVRFRYSFVFHRVVEDRLTAASGSRLRSTMALTVKEILHSKTSEWRTPRQLTTSTASCTTAFGFPETKILWCIRFLGFPWTPLLSLTRCSCDINHNSFSRYIRTFFCAHCSFV